MVWVCVRMIIMAIVRYKRLLIELGSVEESMEMGVTKIHKLKDTQSQ